MRLQMIGIIPLILAALLMTSCTLHTNSEVGKNVHPITDPYEFSLIQWELDSFGDQLWSSLKPASQVKIDDTQTVEEYFVSISEQGNADAALEKRTEDILTLQIRTVLIEEGIIHPLDNWIPVQTVFPPVNFEFENPPHLLVISPREEIKLLSRTVLDPVMAASEKETIEQQVDQLGYSSLVTSLGGVGFTYPTMIYRTSDIRHAIEMAVEEWFHQYMAFKPLGWRYFLDSVGIKADNDIVTMNETVAGIVSNEIADIVHHKYYAGFAQAATDENRRDDFDFDLEMRQIRLVVEQYLADGKIEQAETFMNEKRDFLASNGYHIRKLNQAYFAFHGTYADDPSTVSPIGQDLQDYRKRSGSLREFLDGVSRMTSYHELKNTLEESD